MGAYIVVSVLILIASILLVLVVLVQNSKGGGLASNFSGSNQYMGVRKTADFLEKATWTLSVVVLVLSTVSVFLIPHGIQGGTSMESEQLQILEQKAAEQQQGAAADFTPAPARDEE